MKLEQCEKLKEWGLPQNKSRQYYRDDGKLFYCSEIGLIWADEEDRFACPDLEQLLEFANKKLREIPRTAFSLRLWCPHLPKILYEASIGDLNEESGLAVTRDPDPKQAIYKLFEKIMGEAPHNKEKNG